MSDAAPVSTLLEVAGALGSQPTNNNAIGTHQQYDHREARKAQGNLMEKKQGNANEQKSIYYENLVREYEGDNERSYFYYKAE